ncbi:YqgU-like beta propeller domain-containing protein [Litchfieldia alkalitelluris]|uniref:YqgU-like beta propeller domain-containing protein n=1 Tax=Litchfieldia alkalitelluris TaxID=304268 RepID=UPI00195E6813|nr:hypothetical protein [Litchfieldia alkalitelluris]
MILFIVGCNSSHQLYEVSDVPYGKERVLEKLPVPVEFFGIAKEIQTLDMNGEAFNTVGGWYDNESILYIVDDMEKSSVYHYNLFTGTKKEFFSTTSHILSMKANEDHSLFLLHTSKSRDKANIVVIDRKGKTVLEWEVDSFDLEYSWNPYNHSQLIVTTFLKDWSYKSYLINTETDNITSIELKEPFVKWLDENTIGYMHWETDEPSFSAPLYSYKIETGEEKKLLDDIVSFSTFSDILLTVSMHEDKEAFSFYRFSKTRNGEKLYEYSFPLLSNYSGWFIPYQSYNKTKQNFITFRPYSAGDLDTYSQGFELISLSLENGAETSLFHGIEGLPISFSENGEYGLYGYQFEKIIDLKSKKIIEFIKL